MANENKTQTAQAPANPPAVIEAPVTKYEIQHDVVGTFVKGDRVTEKQITDLGFKKADIKRLGFALPIDAEGRVIQDNGKAEPTELYAQLLEQSGEAKEQSTEALQETQDLRDQLAEQKKLIDELFQKLADKPAPPATPAA